MLHRPSGHDPGGPERIPPVNHMHGGREPGEKQRFLHRRVSSPDDRHLLSAIERPVAGGAGRDPPIHEMPFRGKAQPAGAGAGRDDEGLGAPTAVSCTDPEGTAGEVHRGGVEFHHLGPEPFGLPAEEVHHLEAGDPVGKPGVVLHIGGEHELPPGKADLGDGSGTGQEQGRKLGARRIETCGVAGGTAPDDDEAAGRITRGIHVEGCEGAARLARRRVSEPLSAREPGERGELRNGELTRGGSRGPDRERRPARAAPSRRARSPSAAMQFFRVLRRCRKRPRTSRWNRTGSPGRGGSGRGTRRRTAATTRGRGRKAAGWMRKSSRGRTACCTTTLRGP